MAELVVQLLPIVASLMATSLQAIKNIATRWDPYIIWWDPYDSYPHDSDLFILFEVFNNSLKGSSYIIYPIFYTLIYQPICAIIIIRAYILKLKFEFRFKQIAQGNVESPVRSKIHYLPCTSVPERNVKNMMES